MVPRPMPNSAAPPLIPEFFAGKEVFITGATGFMGKVLVERLLWTCRDVARLHLLLRRKQDAAPEKRLQLLQQSQVFDVIREHCPQQLDKLSAVPGDVTKPQLGLNSHSMSQLNQVSVVFHSAATLKFDEPLAAALDQNVLSAERVMDVCDQLPNLQVLLHVSTAYVGAERRAVAERVAGAPLAPHARAGLAALPPALLARITPELIAPKPNTYTYTKALAESLVAERAPSAHYATAIFRPTIVTSSLRTPFPGWIENLNGPSGVVVGVGKGALHVLNCAGHCRADMIPVDICIDTLIAVAWEAAIDESRSARVYTCSSQAQPVTWEAFRSDLMRSARRYPLDHALWYPFGILIENSVIYKIFETTLQTIPLHLLHVVTSVCGIKPRPKLTTVSKRLQAMNDALKFFAVREWDFETERVQRLRERLAPSDASVFNLDPKTIDWSAHCEDFVRGVRRYLLREEDDGVERARKRMYKIQILHYAMKVFLAYLTGRLALRATPAILRAVATLLRHRKYYVPQTN